MTPDRTIPGLDAFETAFATAESGPDRDFIRAVVPYMVDRRS